jgi:hypothetical protein
MRRPHSYAKRALWAEAKRFARLIGWSWLQLLGVAMVVSVVPILVGAPAWMAGFMAGFFLVFVMAVAGFAFLLNGDATYLVAGAMGEAHTNEELAEAIKQDVIWSVVPNVEVGQRDVDHLVLAPGGVLSLDTKWRIRGADPKWLSFAAGKATDAARLASSVLRSKGVDYATEVTPVVVVWGGARRELPDHQVVDGVDVVRGDHLLEWLQPYSRGRLAQDNAEALHTRLEAFASAHRAGGAPPTRR